jgi:hypothetical protein
MTALRQRMIEDMQLRGLAPGTQVSYVGSTAKKSGNSAKLVRENSTEYIYTRTSFNGKHPQTMLQYLLYARVSPKNLT